MEKSARERLSEAIGLFTVSLRELPGWSDFVRKRIDYALHFDDPIMPVEDGPADYIFEDHMEKKHKLVMCYLNLGHSVHSLKQVEYYFRRYPFRGLPVSRHDHLINICEMYFNRFYEFSERLKNLFDSVANFDPSIRADVGAFIKRFKKEFDREIKHRNLTHHHHNFDSIEIDRLILTNIMAQRKDEKWFDQENRYYYRKSTKIWAERVRDRSLVVDKFLENVAEFILRVCPFLANLVEKKP